MRGRCRRSATTHSGFAKKVGIVVRSHRQVAGAVAELLKPGQLAQFRVRAAAMENRAIFEIPAIFEKILGGSPGKVLAESEVENFKSQI
jgi:hypothetical protein